MTTFKSTIHLPLPVERVYEFLADCNNHEQLQPENIYNWSSTRDEANFTINEKGLLAQNAFANQIYLMDYKVIVPVKVSGTLDKWNAATPGTEMVYGNPINDS